MYKVIVLAVLLGASSLMALASIEDAYIQNTYYPILNIRCDEVWRDGGVTEKLCFKWRRNGAVVNYD